MTSGMYDLGRKKFADADIDWLLDTIKVVLVDAADYTVNLTTHEFLSDVPVGARVKTSGALTGKNSDAGVLDASDLLITSVSGDEFEAVVLFKDTGDPATSPLIAYIDSGTGLPFTPVGTDIMIQWSSGAYRILKL